jgi:flagellar hook-associated protein FlgK
VFFLLFPFGLILDSQFKEGKLMDVGSVVNQGLIGMQKSQSSMLQSAQQIAQAGTTQRDNPQANDVVEPLINIKAQSQVFDSSAKVVRAADETIGTLLDIKA